MKTRAGSALAAAFPTEVPGDWTVTFVPPDYPEYEALRLDTHLCWRRDGETEPRAMTVASAQSLGLLPDPLLLDVR